MIHLRNYSAYSLSEGAIHISDFPVLCHQYGMNAVAITDSNNLFGALEFSLTCAKSKVQPIIGATLTLIDESQVVALCQNETGYVHLMNLVSTIHLQKRFLTIDDILNKNDGLILLTGGPKGPINKYVMNHHIDQAYIILKRFHAVFKDRLYIELQRHGLPEEGHMEDTLMTMAFDDHIPVVATNSCFFKTPDDYDAHDALLCIADGTYISQDKRRHETKEHYFKSSQEMLLLFEDIPEAIEQTYVIAKRCAFAPYTRAPLLPSFPTQEGRSEKEELEDQARLGLLKRLKNIAPSLHEIYSDRLAYELSIIHQMGFNGYFLIVSDFIKYAKSKGIPVGPGRGSGAGSLVAYALTITDMDPICFGLIFERFLNPERISMPDFDIDFCQDRRDEVIAYVQERFGKDRVAHIITFGKLQARAVLRDVGRVMQIPYNQVDRLSKMIPNNPTNPLTLDKALDSEPDFASVYNNDDIVKRLVDLGRKLEGLYRHASTHAAGVVIADRPLLELVPLYLDDKSHIPATQFSMKYAELAGLVKFDFLGLKTLSIIEKISSYIRLSKPNFSISFVSLEDPKTFELLCNVQTTGVFQIESAGMRDVLRKMQPDRFEDLIALVALYRPGPMDDIPKYLARKHGNETITYLHPKLEPILKATYGVMVYQEQVMHIAQSLGGYTLGAADLLRRAMGKKIKSEMDAQRDIFVKGAVHHGIDQHVAEQIFEQMAKFAGYGFNKSHASPYALLSYQTAYLKANYMKEFFAATLTYDMHNTDKLAIYHQDMKDLNVPMYPPCINHSGVDFLIEGHGVRYSLAAIKNVGRQAVETIVSGQPFHTLTDFVQRFDRSSLNKRQMEHLILAGALDVFENNRHQLFSHIDDMYTYNEMCEKLKSSKQKTLFSNDKIDDFNMKPVKPWTFHEQLDKELETFGFYLTSHPVQAVLDQHPHLVESLKISFISSIPEQETSGQFTMMGMMVFKKDGLTKNGKKYAFLQMSDPSGLFNVALFGSSFESYHNLLAQGSIFVVNVTLRTEDNERRRFVVNQMYPYEDFIKQMPLGQVPQNTPIVKNDQGIYDIDASHGDIKKILDYAKDLHNQKKRVRIKINDTVWFFVG